MANAQNKLWTPQRVRCLRMCGTRSDKLQFSNLTGYSRWTSAAWERTNKSKRNASYPSDEAAAALATLARRFGWSECKGLCGGDTYCSGHELCDGTIVYCGLGKRAGKERRPNVEGAAR